jgi:hypothetical protein
MPISKATHVQIQKSLCLDSARFEAKRRAKFVRGMGGSMSGYCDGYADGFEHAIAWLRGEASDPLALEYRPDSGMKHSKSYFRNNPKERARALQWFSQLHELSPNKANGIIQGPEKDPVFAVSAR